MLQHTEVNVAHPIHALSVYANAQALFGQRHSPSLVIFGRPTVHEHSPPFVSAGAFLVMEHMASLLPKSFPGLS